MLYEREREIKRERLRKREREREREIKRERDKEGEREREMYDMVIKFISLLLTMAELLFLFLKGVTGAFAPFSYLVI
jgi:hypothetical protein